MLLEQPPLLMPILEELDVDAFEHVPCAVAEAQVAAQPVARQAARQLARRHALVAADAELKGAADRWRTNCVGRILSSSMLADE